MIPYPDTVTAKSLLIQDVAQIASRFLDACGSASWHCEALGLGLLTGCRVETRWCVTMASVPSPSWTCPIQSPGMKGAIFGFENAGPQKCQSQPHSSSLRSTDSSFGSSQAHHKPRLSAHSHAGSRRPLPPKSDRAPWHGGQQFFASKNDLHHIMAGEASDASGLSCHTLYSSLLYAWKARHQDYSGCCRPSASWSHLIRFPGMDFGCFMVRQLRIEIAGDVVGLVRLGLI